MELFNWQINMKNGDKFIIKTPHNHSGELLRELLGEGKIGFVVSEYETVGRNTELKNANAVSIINTEISSVEYVANWKYE